MKIRAYIYHKRAERYCDCQDYFGITPENNRIAISDGMSQSIFPQWWAKILVNAYLEKGIAPNDIKRYQKIWQEKVNQEISTREKLGNNPWRLKNSVAEKSGAGATLCGFSWLHDAWQCECLGDSCLIAVKKNHDLRFYSSQIGEFGNHPDYYDSFGVGKGEVKKFSGKFSESEILLLVTDPFSELFQKHSTEINFIKDRIAELLTLSDHKSFVDLVENWRDKFNMHNDDSTLIVLDNLNETGINSMHIDDLNQLCTTEYNDGITTICSSFLTKGAQNTQTEQNPTIEDPKSQKGDKDATEILLEAFKDWLNIYSGKMKLNRINDSLLNIVKPIVKEYLKTAKNK